MSKVLKEITVTVGTYQDKTGKTKNRYRKIGSIIETKNGEMLKIDVIPLTEQGGWNGWAWINEPKPQEQKAEWDDAPF